MPKRKDAGKVFDIRKEMEAYEPSGISREEAVEKAMDFLTNNRNDLQTLDYIAKKLMVMNDVLTLQVWLVKDKGAVGQPLKNEKTLFKKLMSFLKDPDLTYKRLLIAIHEISTSTSFPPPGFRDLPITFKSARNKLTSKIELNDIWGLKYGDAVIYAYTTREQAHCSNSYQTIKVGMSLNMLQRLYNIYSYFPRGVVPIAVIIVGNNPDFSDADPNQVESQFNEADKKVIKKVRELETRMFKLITRGYIDYDGDTESFDELEIIPLKTPARMSWNGEWVIGRHDDIVKLFKSVAETESLPVKTFEAPLKNEYHKFPDEDEDFNLNHLCPSPLRDYDLKTGKIVSIANQQIDTGAGGFVPLKEFLRTINADKRLT